MVEKKFENMTVKELRAEAKAKGFINIGKLRKPALLKVLGVVPEPTITAPPPPQPTKPKRTRTRRAPTKETVGEIERGVPIPMEPVRAKYPLEALKSGETFLVTCPAKDAKKIRLNIMNAARRITKKTGATFLVLVWEQEKGVRCWRTDVSIAQVKSSPKKAPKKAADKPILLTEEVAESQEPQGEVVEQLTQEPVAPDTLDTATPPPIVAPTPFKLFND